MSDNSFLNNYLQEETIPYTDSITSKMVMGQTVLDFDTPVEENTYVSTPHSYNNIITEAKKEKRLIAKFFSNISRYGMDFDKDVVDKMRAIPADDRLKDPMVKLMNQDLFNQQGSKWQVKTNQEKNFFEKDLPAKREMLRNLSLQPELEDILDTMTNECIVYDSEFAYFAEPFLEEKTLQGVKDDVRKNMEESIVNTYYKLYRLLDWRNKAWDDFKRYLIEGSMAWEIVYDSLEKPTQVVGIIPVDAATLTKTYENGKVYWVQFKGVLGRERKLLDAQIVYIQYQENVVCRQSYLERLIRPYNIYRIIEQAQIIWTITNSSYKLKFTIPVNGLSKPKAMQTIQAAMNRYKEDIKFSTDTGELKVNGETNLPFNKEYWFPETESGTPEIETMGGDGPDLNDNDQLKYFRSELYRVSKIPNSRFDREDSPSFFGTDTTSISRDEINFGRFVYKLRNTFSKVIIKPLQIQLALDIPELQHQQDLLDAVQLRYNSYNLFEEMFEQEVVLKRAEFVQTMKDSLIDMDADGNDVKYFSSEWLVKKYLKMSDKDIQDNNKYKMKEVEALKAVEGNGEDDI